MPSTTNPVVYLAMLVLAMLVLSGSRGRLDAFVAFPKEISDSLDKVVLDMVIASYVGVAKSASKNTNPKPLCKDVTATAKQEAKKRASVLTNNPRHKASLEAAIDQLVDAVNEQACGKAQAVMDFASVESNLQAVLRAA